MHKISRIGLKCATMTIGSESQVCEMNKRRRIEHGRASFTVDSESKVSAMHKNSRMDLGCASMTTDSKSKVCAIQELAKWSLDEQHSLLRVTARFVQCIQTTEQSSDLQN